jgi:3',5'-cyclic AMP phosphodiesterase CpdA
VTSHVSPAPFVLAHVSDLHVSTFGDTLHDRKHLVKRSARVADVAEVRWETAWDEAGWRVLRERNARRAKVQIVDPEGYAHDVPSVKDGGGMLDPVERAAAKACRLEARRAGTLARSEPTDGALALLQANTPANSNVRCLRAARAVAADGVDAVLVTGDLTDDGEGYELVEAAFSPWREHGRLFAVPGNHDIYRFPVATTARPKPTEEGKRAAWRAFAGRIGLTLDPCGAWFVPIPEASAAIVGLDSCARAQRRFFRHNGAIGEEQIAYLHRLAATPEWRDARHRLVALHHHVVPLPHGVGRKPPTEIGMRLDDARAAAEAFDAIGATLVMHGHRHVSEQRQPAGSNFRILASPSLTLGCRSGDVPSYWRVELGEHAHATRVRIPVAAIEQEEDPDADGEEA